MKQNYVNEQYHEVCVCLCEYECENACVWKWKNTLNTPPPSACVCLCVCAVVLISLSSAKSPPSYMALKESISSRLQPGVHMFYSPSVRQAGDECLRHVGAY